MKSNKIDSFGDRQSASAAAKEALLKRFRAQPAPDSPIVQERLAAQKAIAEAREARAAERNAIRAAEAAKLAAEAKARAAEEAARIAQEKAQAAALEREQKAQRDA